MPQAIAGFERVQSIKLESAPAVPYVLTTVIARPIGEPLALGIRKGNVPNQWFASDAERIAQTATHDYYFVQARIDSGTQDSFSVDDLSDPAVVASADGYDQNGILQPRPTTSINADAWTLLNSVDQSISLGLGFYAPGKDEFAGRVRLLGGYGADLFDIERKPARMWTRLRQRNGYHIWGPFLRTLYKHVPVVPGGELGYLHIFASVMADTPEIQYEIIWHNGGVEERTQQQSGGHAGGTEIGEGNTLVRSIGDITDAQTPLAPFVQFKGKDALFARVVLTGMSSLPPADGFAGAWKVTPYLQDAGTAADTTFGIIADPTDVASVVRQVNGTNPNERHVLPITFERPFRFAVHPTSVTPYQKRFDGMADWSQGGFGFSPMGVPDLSSYAAIDLSAEATAARTLLRTLKPYTTEGEGVTANFTGMLPVSFFLPGSWSQYGGLTSGSGMWPFNGMKQAWTAERDGLDILMVEGLRNRSRTYGALYYNLSGHPVIPILHAPNQTRPWLRFDRRFEKSGGAPADRPFLVSTLNPPSERKVHLAAYNPGPTSGFQAEQPSDPTPSTPDWWVGGAPLLPVALNLVTGATLPYELDLAHTAPPNVTDKAVKVIMQIQGAGAWNNTKSITLRIEGTGEFDVFATEEITLTGPASSPPQVQSKTSVNSWKTISRMAITAKSGTLLSTELLTVGRAGIGIPDYHGVDSITALDGQHAVRYHAGNKALVLLRWDPIAMTFLAMDAMDAMMTWWPGGSARNGRFGAFDHGAPGRGMERERAFAWATDMICSYAAIVRARNGQAVVDAYFGWWFDQVVQHYLNTQMPNKLWQLVAGKEFKQPPLGSSSMEEGIQIFWGLSGRELCYQIHAISMLLNVKGLSTFDLKQRLVTHAEGVRDLAWGVTTAGVESTALANYFPTALNFAAGSSVPKSPASGMAASDIPTIYNVRDDLPEVNPVSGCAIHPGRPGGAGYPTVDDDYIVAEIAGNTLDSGAGTPLTLLNGGQSSTAIPFPVRLTINGGTTFGADATPKRRTFRLVGQDWFGARCNDARYIAERGGDTVLQNSALTPIVNANTGATGQARQVEVVVFGGTTFVNKTFNLEIVGTDAGGLTKTELMRISGDGRMEQRFRSQGAFFGITSLTPRQASGFAFPTMVSTEKFRIGTPTKLMVVQGRGAATQTFHSYQHFKVITSITMLTSSEAAATNNPNVGSLIAGELFRFGVPPVGLRLQATTFPGLEANPIGQEPYHLGYALAILKYYADELGTPAAVDTCILRYTGAGSLSAALAELLAWGENGAGAEGNAPLCQYAPLIWALQQAQAVVADFVGKDANGDQTGAAPLAIGFTNLTIGAAAVNWTWDFGDGETAVVKHPWHVYDDPGTYEVTLTARDANGSALDSETKAAYITAT